MTEDKDFTRVDLSDGSTLLRTASADCAFPHVCAGTKCAVCAWLGGERWGFVRQGGPWNAQVTREPDWKLCDCAWCRRQQTYLSRGGESHYESQAKGGRVEVDGTAGVLHAPTAPDLPTRTV